MDIATWKVALAALVLIAFAVTCGVLIKPRIEEIPEEWAREVRATQRASSTMGSISTERRLAEIRAMARSTPRPTVVTTLADLTVWRFCSAVLDGKLTQPQMIAVYRLDESRLSKDREQKLAVVRLLREQVDQGWSDPAAAREMLDACQEVRQADRERY